MSKRIVLLSDGTGNAASSIWRTNVWRIFQSIDLTSSEQVACYDDGVGTSSFKPLAILGGAFGWGLKRNVIHLYKFLCRNYEPDCQIYAFGFSRGAFTIRVLIGLVANQGIVPYSTEDDLEGKAIAAYRAFRRGRYRRSLGALFRPVRDAWVFLKTHLLGRGQYSSKNNIQVERIHFLGLWDTVAAYGLPVDEWTIGIDRFLWPLELPNRVLWSKVERAYHALSLDDQRTTFQPVLWDEAGAPEGRINQVWFAGVHANVGGGYPDDSLAGVPLLWIMKRAEEAGLHFKVSPKQPDSLLVTESSADKDGRLYDSRAGLASYYRYGPRDVDLLCDDRWHGVTVGLPKVHESVFARMKSKATAYAPVGLPRKYVIVKDDGTIAPQGSAGDMPVDEGLRHRLQQQAWNAVWWRRVFYFLTVAASIHLFLFPLFHPINPSGEYTTRFRFVSESVRVAGEFLPDFVGAWWLNSFATNPEVFLISVIVLAACLLIGQRLATIIADRMLRAWRGQQPPSTLKARLVDSVQGFRTSLPYRSVISYTKYWIAPVLFAIFTLYVVGAAISHAVFYFSDAAGFTCVATAEKAAPTRDRPSEVISFDASDPCFATGLPLKAGIRYVIQIDSPKGWADASYPTDLGGYAISDLPTVFSRITLILATPLRRVLLRRWFRIIARVGETGTDEYFLDPDPGHDAVTRLEVPIVPRRSGQLFLYVNDAVLPFFNKTFYRNNGGTANVTVFQRDRQRR
ncbi:DUF2235 domain-containing protein [Pseudolabrys sp.]|uniref:DUF2235 domain-containing protein n=1 Tax=Pseudolabrys sp. TaxID=1960880 RepID=UPI003D0F0F08